MPSHARHLLLQIVPSQISYKAQILASPKLGQSMDHMEPSLSVEKVVGLFLYLKHHLTVKQFFGKRGILTEDEQVKNVFLLNFLARFISH